MLSNLLSNLFYKGMTVTRLRREFRAFGAKYNPIPRYMLYEGAC